MTFLVVFLVSATATVAVEYCSWSMIMVLFVWCPIFGERCALWLSVGSSFASGIILSSKGYGARGGCMPMVK